MPFPARARILRSGHILYPGHMLFRGESVWVCVVVFVVVVVVAAGCATWCLDVTWGSVRDPSPVSGSVFLCMRIACI